MGTTILDWPGNPDAYGDSVPLRLAGSLNALVRRGRASELVQFYSPNPLPDADRFWENVTRVLAAQSGDLSALLKRAPQTNEVGRSAILYAGLSWFAARMPQPIRLFEVGASGGLNLNLDRYAYRFAGETFGAAQSPLALEPNWEGPLPPRSVPSILTRKGCDLAPVDIATPDGRERLIAYVWPDQAVRLARLQAALAIAQHHPVSVVQSDAAPWVERSLSPAPAWGEAQLLMHSIAFQYFPAETQARIVAHLEHAGESTTRDSPLAWLRFESDPALEKQFSLRLRLWPDGGDHLLALGDPHGRWIRWQAAS